jgi:predicted transcriptional regulator
LTPITDLEPGLWLKNSSDLHQVEEVDNNTAVVSRAGVTLSKYRNQMAWRRNKVKELLARGYRQYDIASTLHISQPTISRDIHYIQIEMRKSAENYDKHRFEVYRNNLLGLDEMIKKLWTIADSPKTDSKEKIKAIVWIGEYYRERLQLIRNEPSLIREMKERERLERKKRW